MTIKDLDRRWLWTTIAGLAAFAVLALLDQRLKAATGFGTRDLQMVATGQAISEILAHWYAPANAVAAGFSLGFDYLFMPLYAFSFYYSALIVRERFTPAKGVARRAMEYLAAVPLAGGIADAIENALQTFMLVTGANDTVANLAFTATSAKSVCFYVGLVLLLAAFLARMSRPKPEPAAD